MTEGSCLRLLEPAPRYNNHVGPWRGGFYLRGRAFAPPIVDARPTDAYR